MKIRSASLDLRPLMLAVADLGIQNYNAQINCSACLDDIYGKVKYICMCVCVCVHGCACNVADLYNRTLSDTLSEGDKPILRKQPATMLYNFIDALRKILLVEPNKFFNPCSAHFPSSPPPLLQDICRQCSGEKKLSRS